MKALVERIGLWVLIGLVFVVLIAGWAIERVTGEPFFPEENEA